MKEVSLIKIGKKFSGTLPSILPEIIDVCKQYNKRNNRKFDPSLRCLALAFNGSRLVEFGENKMKTHPFLKEMYHDHNRMSIHAEADLVMKLLKRNNINKITDVVVLRGTLKLLSSYPCHICYGLLEMYLSQTRLWCYNRDNKKWSVNILDN